ncbi:MAG: helix-turn-helix domain-containing protein [Faecalimonas sp.]|nr:helix-turn-helix domain-containing protein [Faecalimonas sp.]
MGEVHYMIKEAATRVGVERTVLRYWEEELALTIGRTEAGHRYYTEEDLQLFHCIKALKEQGLLLKDLKDLVPDMLHTRSKLRIRKLEAAANALLNEEAEDSSRTAGYHLEENKKEEYLEFSKALAENNKVLEQTISLAVTKAVVSEMDFLLQAKERLEEERYKKLDNLIRQQQNLRREASNNTVALKGFRKIFAG